MTVPARVTLDRRGRQERSKRKSTTCRSTATIPSSGRRGCAASVWWKSRRCRSCRSRATRRWPRAWSCTRTGRRRRRARAPSSSFCCSTTRWIVRSATRAASAISRTSRWPTARAPRVWPSRRLQAEGRRSRADDRARRGALHRLPALRALRRHHHERAFAGGQRPRRARHHRDGDGRPLRLELQRQRDRDVPGRRADVEDVSLQLAAVGSAAHGDDLSAVPRRLRAERRRAARRRAAHDVGSRTIATSDGWLCDRGRYNVGFYGDARRLTAPLLREGAEWIQIGWDDAIALWAPSIRARSTRADRRASRAIGGGRLLNEEAYLLQHVFRAARRARISIGAPGGSASSAPARSRGTYEGLERAQAIVRRAAAVANSRRCMDLRIRKAVQRNGARLFSLGDHPARSSVPETNVASVDELKPALPAAFDRVAVIWDGIDNGEHDAALMAHLAAHWSTRQDGRVVHRRRTAQRARRRGDGHAAARHRPRDARRSLRPRATVSSTCSRSSASIRRCATKTRRWRRPRSRRCRSSSSAICSRPRRPQLRVAAPAGARPVRESGPRRRCDRRRARGARAPTSRRPARSPTARCWSRSRPNSASPFRRRRSSKRSRRPSRPRSRPRRDAAEAQPAAAARPALRVAIGANVFAGGGSARFDDAIAALRPGAARDDLACDGAGVRRGRRRHDRPRRGRPARSSGLTVLVDREQPDGVVAIVDGLPDAPANAIGDGAAVEVRNVKRARELAAAGGA